MKVKDIIKKYCLYSNAKIVIRKLDGGVEELSHNDIMFVEPEELMNARVSSFDIINNVMTIYTR